MVAFGSNVRALRLARNWTQAELAARIGVRPNYVTHIEAGRKRNPKLDTLCKLRHAFDISLDELVRCPDETLDAA
jgi:transcriptional regulator with XRE-family HTH domain